MYAQWAKPYYRIAELSTLAFAPFAIAGFLLIYYYSSEDLFYWLSPSPDEHLSAWLNIDWLLIRNLFGLLLFYGLSAIYIVKAMRPDMAQAKIADGPDNTEADPGADPSANRGVERQLYLMSFWVIASFIICNTLLSWDFAMMIIPHWHSTVFPIHFWFGNVLAATAAMMLIPAALGRFSATESRFGPRNIRQLSMLITAFVMLWMYFFWAQFFVIWFGNLPHETDPLWRQAYGHYSPYYWAMLAGCFFIPLGALIFSIFNRSVVAMCIIGLGISVGIWLNKFLMVAPVYSPDVRPFDNMQDVGLSIALLAAFLVVVIFLARRYPVYSYWGDETDAANRRANARCGFVADAPESSPDTKSGKNWLNGGCFESHGAFRSAGDVAARSRRAETHGAGGVRTPGRGARSESQSTEDG